jgi:hypothetical protein
MHIWGMISNKGGEALVFIKGILNSEQYIQQILKEKVIVNPTLKF